MNTQVVINLPAADLRKSQAFYEALGFRPNPQGTGDTTAMFVLNEAVSIMLMTHAQFQQFTPRAICDTTRAAEALFVLGCESHQAVDDMVAKAVAAGGTADKAEDFGFMYTHGFLDLDGHGWGLTYMEAPPPQG